MKKEHVQSLREGWRRGRKTGSRASGGEWMGWGCSDTCLSSVVISDDAKQVVLEQEHVQRLLEGAEEGKNNRQQSEGRRVGTEG